MSFRATFDPEQHNILEVYSTEKETSHNAMGSNPFYEVVFNLFAPNTLVITCFHEKTSSKFSEF